MNPIKLLQLKNSWDQFSKRHPKLIKFFNIIANNAAKEGTIIEMKATTAEGKTYAANFKLSQSDLALCEDLKDMFLKQ